MSTRTKSYKLQSINLANLSKAMTNRLLPEDSTHESEKLYDQYCASPQNKFDAFLKNGKTLIKYDKYPIFHDGGSSDCWFTVKDGVVYEDVEYLEDIEVTAKTSDNDHPAAVIIPCDKQAQKYLVIYNGDEDPHGYNVLEPASPKKIPYQLTISFACLARFFSKDTSDWGGPSEKEVKKQAARLANGELKLVDYQRDSRIPLTPEENKLRASWEKKVNNYHTKIQNGETAVYPTCPLTPPQSGFTLVGREWHRSATAVIYDKENKFTILMGQDEGTYFGVELADNPETVAQAYKSLMPQAIRNKKNVERQGEWFALPTNPPDVEDCILEIYNPTNEEICLGRDSEDSAQHWINGADQIMVAKDGVIYAKNPTLHHENGDHQDLVCTGWTAFYRNTAVRSFSQEGVD